LHIGYNIYRDERYFRNVKSAWFKSTLLLKVKTSMVFVYKNVLRNKDHFEKRWIIYRIIRYEKRVSLYFLCVEKGKRKNISRVDFTLVTAATAAPSATSAPKPPFPGPGAARVGAPAGASSAVAAPLRVRPEAVLILVSLRLALGYRFGS
jgi:hypothetical protein